MCFPIINHWVLFHKPNQMYNCHFRPLVSSFHEVESLCFVERGFYTNIYLYVMPWPLLMQATWKKSNLHFASNTAFLIIHKGAREWCWNHDLDHNLSFNEDSWPYVSCVVQVCAVLEKLGCTYSQCWFLSSSGRATCSFLTLHFRVPLDAYRFGV